MKKIFIGLTVIVSVICCLCFTVLAEDYNNDFFDFDEYAKYSYDSSTNLITADIDLPNDWRWAFIKDSDGITQWYNTFDFSSFLAYRSLSIDFNPFSRTNVTSTVNHVILRDCHFLDLQYIPSGSSLNIKLVTRLYNRNLTSNFADIFVAFVDSTGKVISHATVPTTLDLYEMGRDGVQYTVSGVYSFDSVPSNATGFYYVIRCSTHFTSNESIEVVTVDSSLVFKYSEQNYNIKQNEIIRDKVSNIEKQLDGFINGSVTPNSPDGKQDFDDLHNNEQELLDQSQNYLDNGLSFFQNASGVILGLGNGFEAIKVLVQPVFALPFANSLITVSISLGLIATLIGVAISSISNGNGEKKAGKDGKKSAKGGKQ